MTDFARSAGARSKGAAEATRRPTEASLLVTWPLRGSSRRTGRRRGLFWHPRHRVAVVFEALRAFEGILGRVHDQVPLVIVLVRDLDGIEGDGDVLFAHPEKAADADDERGGLALTVDEHIHDLADLAVVGVIDALLVPVGDGHAVGWDARHDLRSRAAALLLGLSGRARRNERN